RGVEGSKIDATVTWSLERIAGKPKQKPELAIRADITVPERGLEVTWVMRRNTDKSAFATHVVSVTVQTPDKDHGMIRDLFGMLLGSSEESNPTALFASHEKADYNAFRSYLSPADFSMRVNDKLIRERSWIELRFTFRDGERAILAMDKGSSGARVFAAAL